jgi:hypothetical protein
LPPLKMMRRQVSPFSINYMTKKPLNLNDYN